VLVRLITEGTVTGVVLGRGNTMFMAVNSAIAAFGSAAAGMAVAVGTGGAVNGAANVAALNPALGLIGQDFLVAFGAAQASYLEGVAETTALYGGIAASAAGTVGAYTGTEVAGVARLLAAGLV
jgi:hypothetical protein